MIKPISEISYSQDKSGNIKLICSQCLDSNFCRSGLLKKFDELSVLKTLEIRKHKEECNKEESKQ